MHPVYPLPGKIGKRGEIFLGHGEELPVSKRPI